MSDKEDDAPHNGSLWSNFLKGKFYFPSWNNLFKTAVLLLMLIAFIYLVRLVVGESGVVNLLTSLAWPVAIVFVAMNFKNAIEGFASRMTEISAPGFAARAHSEAALLAASKIENNEASEPYEEPVYSEENNIDEVEKPVGQVDESIERSDSDKSSSGANDDEAESESFNDVDSLDYNELRSRLKKISSERRRYPDDLVNVNNNKFINTYLKKSIHGFKGNLLASNWNKLVAVIDDLYTDYFYDKNDLNDFQKMKRLYSKDIVTNEQLETFKKLFEAEDVFSDFLDVETKYNYLYTIARLEDSLSKLVKIK